jgi:hypothetical protein
MRPMKPSVFAGSLVAIALSLPLFAEDAPQPANNQPHHRTHEKQNQDSTKRHVMSKKGSSTTQPSGGSGQQQTQPTPAAPAAPAQ